jgi:hypothetical protein
MNSKLDIYTWPNRWFGFWREHGEKGKNCPSVFDFVIPEINRTYDKERLVHYLRNAPIITATSRSEFLNPFNSTEYFESICFRSDGVWLWVDDLAEYIVENDVVIPVLWLKHILQQKYQLPSSSEIEEGKLDWPDLE